MVSFKRLQMHDYIEKGTLANWFARLIAELRYSLHLQRIFIQTLHCTYSDPFSCMSGKIKTALATTLGKEEKEITQKPTIPLEIQHV